MFKEEIGYILDEVRREAALAGKDPGQVLHNRVYVGLAVKSQLFRRAVSAERLLDILEAIISPNISFLSDKVVFKNESADFGSPWHQDWPY